MGRSNGELRALTSLRFFAAAAIVLHHSQGSFGVPRGIGQPFVLDHAVSFFFILSGFILTYVHPRLEAGQRGAFLWARLARIWPGHVAVLGLLLLGFGQRATDSGRIEPGVLGANALLLQAWIPYRDYYFSYNGASWSVSAEAFFYLSFPLLVHRLEQTWYLKLPLVLAVSLGMVALGNAWQLPAEETGGVIGADALTYIHPLARWFEFALGMCTALLHRRLALRSHWSRAAGTLLELATGALVLYVMARTGNWSAWLGRSPWIGVAGMVWLVHGPLAAPVFALGIAVFGLQRGLLSRLLSGSGLVLLGEISYAMYLLHIGVLRIFWQKLPAVALASDPWIYPCFWLLLLLLSHLFWALVERPARTQLARLWPLERGGDRPEKPTGPPQSPASPRRRWIALGTEAALVALLLGAFGAFHRSAT